MPVPNDFPRNPFPSALPGARLKFVAREVNGRFVVGLTEDELEERYQVCNRLLEDLVVYARRKAAERPDWTNADLLKRICAGIKGMNAGFSDAEITWLADQVAKCGF